MNNSAWSLCRSMPLEEPMVPIRTVAFCLLRSDLSLDCLITAWASLIVSSLSPPDSSEKSRWAWVNLKSNCQTPRQLRGMHGDEAFLLCVVGKWPGVNLASRIELGLPGAEASNSVMRQPCNSNAEIGAVRTRELTP